MIKLFPFQQEAIPKISDLLKIHDNILCVSPGGSGKTVIISATTQLWLLKNPTKKICVFVHREELFNQTREKLIVEILYKELLLKGIMSQGIDSFTTFIDPNVQVYTIMVETFNIRAESENFLKYFLNVGLYFCDEAHRTDFNKIFKYFPNSKRLGFTATPISANKLIPLKDNYQVMIEIAKVSQLQELNSIDPSMGVVPIDLYQFGNVDRSKFDSRGGEFNEKQVSKEFRKLFQIENVIEHYFKFARGMKILCFDADIDHSIEMMHAYLDNGINARHVNGGNGKSEKYPNDAKKFGTKKWRRDSLEWLKYTPDAVLDNVGILTTGFDEKSVESVFINSSMMSLSLYIQKVVRVSRPYQYENGNWKVSGLVLDFGNNASETGGNFGDCNQDHDWFDWYENPNKPKRQGVGGFKSCPECKSLNTASSRFCKGFKSDLLSGDLIECGYIFPISVKEQDSVPREMVKYFNSNIDVKQNVEYFVNQMGFSLGRVYYETINQIANFAKKQIPVIYLDSIQLKFLFDIAFIKIKDLGKFTKRRSNKETIKKDLIKKLKESGFFIHNDEISELEK